MCSVIDDINGIKQKNSVANDFVIFIDTMEEYLIQDVLKFNLNVMMECGYERAPEQEIPDTAVTILTSALLHHMSLRQ